MKTVTLSLPDSLATQLEQNVALYGYEDVGEYVTDVLRGQQEDLKELLLEGLNSGEPIPATQEFWAELRRYTDALLVEHQQSLDKVSAA